MGYLEDEYPDPDYSESPHNLDRLHELLQTTHIINDMFARHVVEADITCVHADVNALVEKIAEDLGRLYQLIGSKLV